MIFMGSSFFSLIIQVSESANVHLGQSLFFFNQEVESVFLKGKKVQNNRNRTTDQVSYTVEQNKFANFDFVKLFFVKITKQG